MPELPMAVTEIKNKKCQKSIIVDLKFLSLPLLESFAVAFESLVALPRRGVGSSSAFDAVT